MESDETRGVNSRISDLDGLRGVAVLIVIALHVFKRADYFTENPILTSITGLTTVGWVGVDIFFTLSGFLITSILLQARNEANYFKNFYMRRALRIVPLYLVLILFVLFLAPKVEPEFTSQLSILLPVLLLYQQNWIVPLADLYLTDYLGVTWSLAIEEQFYLLWPFLVYYLNTRQLIKFSIWAIVISFAARVAGVIFFADIVSVSNFFYYNSFTRFEQIIIGALLALLFTFAGMKERVRRFSGPAFVVFFSIFVVLCLLSLPGLPNPGRASIPLTVAGYTIVGLFSAALIGIFITHPASSLVRRFFQNPILVAMGKYSYSMYLFHVPVTLIFLDIFWQNDMRGGRVYLLYVASSFIVTMIIAWLTWNLLEKHVLDLKKYFVNEKIP
jgi:peptidoglycan/LPS O-acetylase OafA/YrhL